METEIRSNYRGSPITFEDVKKQISERFGAKAAEEYSAYTDCLSYNAWKKFGYIVNRGQKALHSIVMIEKKNPAGIVIGKYPKRISLFYKTQVHKVE